jgi:hypothetical protein
MMVHSLDFNTTNIVLESWEAARKSPAFEESVGLLTLEK